MGAAPLRVAPGPFRGGRFRPPGDKSITHRAILLGLLAAGRTEIRGANPGADCAATLACARRLGAAAEECGGALVLTGAGGRLAEPDDVLDCGNSGTTLRLLAGVLAGQPLHAVLTGDDSLRRRPVARVIEPLRAMGATLSARDGDRLPPLVVRGAELRGRVFESATPSAQVASAILLAGLQARGRTEVRVRAGTRDHTARMLPAFGIAIEAGAAAGGATTLAIAGPAVPRGCALSVPGDPSAAAFFLAAAAATPGARVVAEHVSLNPTRLGLLETLAEMGARIEVREQGSEGGEPFGEIEVEGPERLRGTDVPPARVPAMVDEIPAWTIAACAAHGTSRLAGAAELRVKESDRLAALARNLAAVGIAAEERADGLAITGGAVRGGRIEARHDHRIAMTFAVLGARSERGIEIDDAASIATSFPGFLPAFAALGGRFEERSTTP